ASIGGERGLTRMADARPLTESRIHVAREGLQLTIDIPGARNPDSRWRLRVAGAWIVACSLEGAHAILRPRFGLTFTSFFFVFSARGLYQLARGLTSVLGTTRLERGVEDFVIRRRVFGIERTRRGQIRNLLRRSSSSLSLGGGTFTLRHENIPE